MMRVAALMTVAGLLQPAHGPYDGITNARTGVSCCSGEDCAPYPDEMVKETAAGFSLADGKFVARKDAQPSFDKRFHRCDNRYTGGVRCFLFPSQSM